MRARPDGGELGVLRERVEHLAVAGLHLGADERRIQRGLWRERVHLLDQPVQVGVHHEVGALLLEPLDGRGRAGEHAREDAPDALAREVGVLLRSRERELLLDDGLREDEPRVVVAGRAEVREGAERVEAREVGRREAAASGVEPQRRRAGEDADAVRVQTGE